MKIVVKLLLILLAVVLLAAAMVFCYLLLAGSPRYTRKLETVENDTDVEIIDSWAFRKLLNIGYHQKVKAFEQSAEPADTGTVLFLGDSITDYMELSDYYPEFQTINQGIAGDTTRGVLNRMEQVYAVKPSVVVLLIGINDLMNEKRLPENIAVHYRQILSELKQQLPDTTIICQSVYPGYNGTRFLLGDLKNEILKLNRVIAQLSEDYGCVFADTYSVLTDDNGLLPEELSDDGCHPNAAGYEITSAFLKPIIQAQLQS